MKQLVFLIAATAFAYSTASAEYDFFAGARYPGGIKKPGVGLYEVNVLLTSIKSSIIIVHVWKKGSHTLNGKNSPIWSLGPGSHAISADPVAIVPRVLSFRIYYQIELFFVLL